MGILGKPIYGIRRTGEALNRFYFQEQLSKQPRPMNMFDKVSVFDKDALLAPIASSVIGNVNNISVASETNIQDSSLVHVAKSKLSGKVLPTVIRDNVSVASYKFTYYRKSGGYPMIGQISLNHASNFRFYSSLSIISEILKHGPIVNGRRRFYAAPRLVCIESDEEFDITMKTIQGKSLSALFHFGNLDFTPCKELIAVIGKLNEEYPCVETYFVLIVELHKAKLRKTLSKQSIEATPSLLFWKEGKMVRKIVGADFKSLKTTMKELYC